MLINENRPSKMNFFLVSWIFLKNFDFQNACKNEFKDNDKNRFHTRFMPIYTVLFRLPIVIPLYTVYRFLYRFIPIYADSVVVKTPTRHNKIIK